VTAPYWCVARTEPRREAVAARFLGRAGYEVYLPRVRETHVNRGRRVTTAAPLFACYAIVRVERGWWEARRSPGVIAIIMSGDGPAKLADEIVDELKARERDGLVQLPEPPCLRPGDAVRITGGPLSGVLGIYSGMRGADRVAVLLGLLGTAVLPAAGVERV
jgi:transcription antitermination factor NusG